MAKKQERDNLQESAPAYDEPEKLTRKEKIAYEKELVREGKILPRYSPRNPFGRLLALILVFFVGLFAAIGGIIGTFAYLGTRPVKEGFKLFNLDYEKFITEDAANKSVLDLTQTIADYQKLNSLAAISEYTPLVDTLLNGLETQLAALGVHVDKDELSATPFDQIGAYFSENVVQSLVLGEALSLKPGDNALLLTLCFGEEGVDYDIVTEQTEEGEQRKIVMKEGHSAMTVGSLKGSDMSSMLDKITLEAAMDVTAASDPAIRYLAYGSEGVNYEIHTDDATGEKSIVMLNDPETQQPFKKKTIAALTAADANLLGGAKIGDLVQIDDGAQGILGAVKDWTIEEMGNDEKLKSLRIGDIVDLSSATGIMKTIADKGWTIQDLTQSATIESLKISEIVDAPATGIMGAVRDWSISDLSNTHRINRIKISQLIDTSSASGIVKKLSDWRVGDLSSGNKFDTLLLSDVITIDNDSPVILRTLADTALGDCANAIDELHLSEILGDVSGNKLLGKLQNSTLSTLAKDIEGFTVADMFGDELYSYMLKTDKDGAPVSYAQVVRDYEEGHKTEAGSKKDINPHFIRDEEQQKKIKKYFVHGADEVVFGVFEQANGVYRLVTGDFTVYSEGAQRYIHRDLKLLPVRTWMLVDYENGGLTALPQGDEVTTDATGKTLGTPADVTGTPAKEGTDDLYYASGETYYPLYEDQFGVYYVNAERARIDLDCAVTEYETENGEKLALNGNKVTYGGVEYGVRTKSATQTQAEYSYIQIKVTVEEYYYDPDDSAFTAGEGGNLYAPAAVAERWHIDNGDGTFTEVDRFLDGIWYLLFGGEVRDSDGKLVLTDGEITAIDNTNAKLFDVANTISNVKNVLNDTPLWKLYLHGILSADANPYVELPGGGNLNDLTIKGCIAYIAAVSAMGTH